MKTFEYLVASAAVFATSNATIETQDDITNYSMADFNIFSDIKGIPDALKCMACGKATDWVDGVLKNKKFLDYIFDAIGAACWISGLFHPRSACH